MRTLRGSSIFACSKNKPNQKIVHSITHTYYGENPGRGEENLDGRVRLDTSKHIHMDWKHRETLVTSLLLP